MVGKGLKSPMLTVMSSFHPFLCNVDVLTFCSHQGHPTCLTHPHNCQKRYMNLWLSLQGLFCRFRGDVPVISRSFHHCCHGYIKRLTVSMTQYFPPRAVCAVMSKQERNKDIGGLVLQYIFCNILLYVLSSTIMSTSLWQIIYDGV